MDRFKWSDGRLKEMNEETLYQQTAVSFLNLEDRTAFIGGKLELTSHRLIWHDKSDIYCKTELKLSLIKNAEIKQVQQMGSNRLNKQNFPRILLRLYQNLEGSESSLAPPSFQSSNEDAYVQFEFEYGGHKEFYDQLNQQLNRKSWLNKEKNEFSSKHNVGILGIQRKIQDRLELQDQQINESFKDLGILMNQAKEMVTLSQTIVGKISKDKLTAESNEDDEEMKKLKGYFLNMGIIDNPVTKESSGSKYHKELAVEIANNFLQTIINQGGIMTLSDVYCRLNRARAIAGLVSPEDLLNACKQINKLNLKIKYNIYADLNLHVLEVESSNLNTEKLDKVCKLVEDNESLTPYALSKIISCSLIVARKNLLDSESLGRLCRDDTSMGLRFYKNLFLIQ